MQVSFRTIQLTDGKKRVNGALRARAAVRPALRQGSAFLLGLAGGWAVLYGALMPFGLGLTLGFAEDCFAVGAAGAALGVLARSFGTLTVESVCLLCALGAAVAARWLWPDRFVPAVAAGCGTLVGSAVCFAAGEENGVQTILFCGGDALLAAAAGYGLRRFPPEKPGMGSLILSAAVAAALGGRSFGFFLPGVMACAAAELALCCKGLPLEALAFSGVTGAALAASDPALAPAAAGLACGCAAAAVLAPARRVEGLAAYAGGCVAGVLCVQPLAGAFSFLLSAGAGAGLCALLPAGWLMPALKEDDPPGDERPRLSAAATRLEAVAESLSSLAETVNEVYDAFPRRCEGFRWVIDNIHDGLCANCGRREVCWKQEHASTLEGMEALRPILEEKGHLEAALLPGQLARCIHPAALCAAGDKAFALYRSRREARVHSEAMRTALTEQYSAVADALGVLSEQLGRPGSPEPYKSGRVSALFAQLGTPPLECAVTLDDLGRTRAAVTLPAPASMKRAGRSGRGGGAHLPPQPRAAAGALLQGDDHPALCRKAPAPGRIRGGGRGGAGRDLRRRGPAVLQRGGGPDDTLRRHGDRTSGGSRRQPCRRADGTPAQSGLYRRACGPARERGAGPQERRGERRDPRPRERRPLYRHSPALQGRCGPGLPRAWGKAGLWAKPACRWASSAASADRAGWCIWRRGTMWCWCRTAS